MTKGFLKLHNLVSMLGLHKPLEASIIYPSKKKDIITKHKVKPLKLTGLAIICVFAVLIFAHDSESNSRIEIHPKDPRQKMIENNRSYHERSMGNPKLSSSLNQLVEAYRQGGIAEAKIFARNRNIVLREECVQVTIVTTEEAIDDVRDAVEIVGGKYQLHYRNLLQAMVPMAVLEVFAQRQDVQIIREPWRPLYYQKVKEKSQ